MQKRKVIHSSDCTACRGWYCLALYQTVLAAAATGFCSEFDTDVAMKTGIKWMREMMIKMDARLTRLEKKSHWLAVALLLITWCGRGMIIYVLNAM